MNTPQNILARDFFTFELDFPALAAAASATKQITIQAESDFQLQKLMFFADVAAAGQTNATAIVPLATVLITDTGSGRQLMDNPVPIPSIFGRGEFPFILPNPRIFKARTSVNVTVTNFDAAQTYNLRLSFVGLKLFYGA